MNERIRELIKQVGTDTGGRWVAIDNVEKLAELIVADCVRIVEGYCETSPEINGLPLEILEHFHMEIE